MDLTSDQLGGDCALTLADRLLNLEKEPDLRRMAAELRG
jgi:hypothetical protein